MKLITEELKARFAEVGSQDGCKDPLVIAKFFDPMGSGNWWATAYDPKRNICFGYVSGLQLDEWGYFSIDELEAIERPFGLTIERNIHFQEQLMSKLIPQALIDLGYL